MVQFLRPVADTTVGDWTVAPLWSKVNGTAQNDSPLITSTNSNGSECVLKLSAAQAPAAGTRTIIVRVARTDTGGSNPVLRTQLRQGTSVIQEWTFTTTSTAFANATSAVDTSSVTDWSDLNIRLVREGGGSNANRRPLRVSWVQLEIPEAAPPPPDPEPPPPGSGFIENWQNYPLGAFLGGGPWTQLYNLDPSNSQIVEVDGARAWRYGDGSAFLGMQLDHQLNGVNGDIDLTYEITPLSYGGETWTSPAFLTWRNTVGQETRYFFKLTSGSLDIFRVQAGTFTQLLQQPRANTIGTRYRIRVRHVGSSLQVWLNDESVLNITENAITSGPVDLRCDMGQAHVHFVEIPTGSGEQEPPPGEDPPEPNQNAVLTWREEFAYPNGPLPLTTGTTVRTWMPKAKWQMDGNANTGYHDYAGNSYNRNPNGTDSNPFVVENGTLRLSIVNETRTFTDPTNPSRTSSPWQGGMLITDPRTVTFTEGYFEFRARYPNPGRGMFPALWSFATDGSGSKDGAEIDMFEIFGWEPGTPWAISAHHYSPTGPGPIYGPQGWTSPSSQDTTDWHRYGFLRTDTHLYFFRDGELVFTASGPDAEFFAGVAMDLRINFSIAANGHPSWMGDSGGFTDANTPSPMHAEVDYVRAYDDLPPEALELTTDDPLNYQPPPDPDPPPTGEQAFYDFQSDIVGQLPAGWETGTNGTGFTVSDASVPGFGTRHLRLTNTAEGERALYATFADGQQNVELHARCRIISGGDGYFHQMFVRALQNPEQQSIVGFHSRFGTLSFSGIDRYLGGSWSSGPEGNPPLIPNGTTYRMEMRANGTTVELRVWPESGTRPSTPLTLSNAGTQSGRHGVGGYVGGAVMAFDWVGVGINGATAPTAPLSVPPQIFTRTHAFNARTGATALVRQSSLNRAKQFLAGNAGKTLARALRQSRQAQHGARAGTLATSRASAAQRAASFVADSAATAFARTARLSRQHQHHSGSASLALSWLQRIVRTLGFTGSSAHTSASRSLRMARAVAVTGGAASTLLRRATRGHRSAGHTAGEAIVLHSRAKALARTAEFFSSVATTTTARVARLARSKSYEAKGASFSLSTGVAIRRTFDFVAGAASATYERAARLPRTGQHSAGYGDLVHERETRQPRTQAYEAGSGTTSAARVSRQLRGAAFTAGIATLSAGWRYAGALVRSIAFTARPGGHENERAARYARSKGYTAGQGATGLRRHLSALRSVSHWSGAASFWAERAARYPRTATFVAGVATVAKARTVRAARSAGHYARRGTLTLRTLDARLSRNITVRIAPGIRRFWGVSPSEGTGTTVAPGNLRWSVDASVVDKD